MNKLLLVTLVFVAGLALGLALQPDADPLAGVVVTMALAEGPGPMSGAACRQVGPLEYICHGDGPWQLHLDGWKKPLSQILPPFLWHGKLLAGLP